MTIASATIGEITRALDFAAVEMLAVGMSDMRVLDCTQRLVQRWGCSVGDLVGQQMSYAPAGLLQIRTVEADAAGTEAAERIEVTFRPPQRSPAAARFRPRLVGDDGRQVLLLIGCAFAGLDDDGAARLAARERTIARLQALARAASWTLDPWSGEAEWSDAMFTLFGLDRSMAPSFNNLVAMLDPAHRERWHHAFAEACRKRPVSDIDCDFRRPSGERRRIRLAIDPEPRADGRIARLSGICQDVTDAAPGEPWRREAGPATGMAEQVASLLMVIIDNVDYACDLTSADESVERALKTAGEAARLGLDLTSPGNAVAAEPAREPDARPVVVVADDDAPVRKLVTAMIESLGCSVVEAANGADALAVIESRADIALIVSDLVMDGMDGAELAARALELRPDLKILLASGFDGDGLAARLPEPVDVIAKPFTRAALADKVRQALEPAKVA